jgi:hypothetical protein
MKTLKTEFVANVEGQDDIEGNYYVIDVATNQQFMARVYSNGAGDIMVHSVKDHEEHAFDEFNHASLRWFKIEPVEQKVIDRLLQPV